MFRELFENTEKEFKAYVCIIPSENGITMLDPESGEVADFKDVSKLIKAVQAKPRDYASFYRKSSDIVKKESKDIKGADSALVKIKVYPSWAKSVGLK